MVTLYARKGPVGVWIILRSQLAHTVLMCGLLCAVTELVYGLAVCGTNSAVSAAVRLLSAATGPRGHTRQSGNRVTYSTGSGAMS